MLYFSGSVDVVMQAWLSNGLRGARVYLVLLYKQNDIKMLCSKL